MERTCPNCGNAFAHASGLSRHKKFCGTSAPRHPCPYCATTFTQYGNLRRHVQRSCKKRPAAEKLPENPPEKRPLVDYSSSEEEPMEVELATEQPVHPFESWRTTTESDTESEEVQPSHPSDEEPWDIYEQQPLEDTPSDTESEEPSAESSDEWHTAEESWEDEVTPHSEETSSLNLDSLREALPWAQYQGMSEEQFGGATQRMEGNPLFQFDFTPVNEQQWLRRVQKTIYHTQLRQRREPVVGDDMGVAIVTALEEATRQHLERIGARDEDRVFLALTPHGFDHRVHG